jgi:hypothetical protein
MSAFRELESATNLKQGDIVRALGVSRGAVAHWEQGTRPPWHCLGGLTELFKIDLPKVVTLLWGESVGDPCSCGCDGEKVLPNKADGQHLSTKLNCTNCGKERIYAVMQGNDALCKPCSYASRKVERG